LDLIAFIDGGARGNPGPAAIGIVISDDSGNRLFEQGLAIGRATNNEAEYQALIHLLEACAEDPLLTSSGATKLRVHSDSLLLVSQITGEWKIKEPRLQELYKTVQTVKRRVKMDLRIKHVPREENKEADRLVNEALDKAAVPAKDNGEKSF
jgi:ribonuclease HI